MLDPGTNISLNGLNDTVGTLNPMIRYLGPYATVCNDWNYFWVELADLVSEQTTFGMAQRALIMFGNQQANSVAKQGATATANGYQPGDVPDQGYPGDAEYLHGPDVRGGDRQPGQRRLRDGAVRVRGEAQPSRPEGPQPAVRRPRPRRPGRDVHRPLARPAGRDVQPQPETGPQLPYIPSNP